MAVKLQRVQGALAQPTTKSNGATTASVVSSRKSLIPTEYREPASELSRFPILIYGAEGVGKSSLALQFPAPLAFEVGGGMTGLKCMPAVIRSWSDFRGTIDELMQSPDTRNRFSNYIVDATQRLYDMCMDHVCKVEGIKHPQDQQYGKGWKAVSREFNRAITDLLGLGGVIFLAHFDIVNIESASGNTWQQMMPKMTGQCAEALKEPVRIKGYYGFSQRDRFLWIEGDDYLDAKCSADENFWTKDGDRVRAIPMGESKEEAYENLIRAFNNEQETSEGNRKMTLPNRKAPMKK